MNATADSPQSEACRQPSSGSPAAARPILLLGLGNDILTDDAIGLRVVRLLADELSDHPRLEACATTEMGLSLLDHLIGREQVLVVDAIQTGQVPPGSLLELDPAAWGNYTGRNPHFLGVGETLALGRHLGLPMPQQVKILAIEVADPFTLGTALTPALQTALPRVVARVRQVLEELMETGSGRFAADV